MLKISKNIHYLDPTNTYDIFDISSSCNNNLITNHDDLDNVEFEHDEIVFTEWVKRLLCELNFLTNLDEKYKHDWDLYRINYIKDALKEAGIILFERKELNKYIK